MSGYCGYHIVLLQALRSLLNPACFAEIDKPSIKQPRKAGSKDRSKCLSGEIVYVFTLTQLGTNMPVQENTIIATRCIGYVAS